MALNLGVFLKWQKQETTRDWTWGSVQASPTVNPKVSDHVHCYHLGLWGPWDRFQILLHISPLTLKSGAEWKPKIWIVSGRKQGAEGWQTAAVVFHAEGKNCFLRQDDHRDGQVSRCSLIIFRLKKPACPRLLFLFCLTLNILRTHRPNWQVWGWSLCADGDLWTFKWKEDLAMKLVMDRCQRKRFSLGTIWSIFSALLTFDLLICWK